MNNLYKVKVETEIMVMADNEKSAIEIAKKNAPSEVNIYGRGTAQIVHRISEIPEDWKSVIPYGSEGSQETRKCFEIVSPKETTDKSLPEEEIQEIIKIKDNSKSIAQPFEIKPETRPDPKQKELDWHETKSGRPMPSLRFVRSK